MKYFSSKPMRTDRIASRLAPGLTMIELLVVLAIVGVLALVAVPSLTSVLNNMQQSSALNLLVSDLNLARGEAIKRNTRVLMCARNSAGTDCLASTDWQAGWLVCLDANRDNTCDASSASSPNPLLVRSALNAQLTLRADSSASMRFNASSAAAAAVLFTLGGSWSGATTQSVNVAVSGHISKQ